MPPADRRLTDRLVFLHGFTQTHHHWHQVALGIAATLDTTPTLTFVDLPGHGLSGHDRSSIDDAVAALPRLAGAGTYIGYSMGARHALLAAVGGAPAVERLVLIGGTAGIDDDDERTARISADADRAHRLERDGVSTFVDAWLAAPMFAGLPSDSDALEHRLRNTPAGLAHSLRTGGTAAQPSIWHRLDEIRVPTMVVAGESDEKFTEIGTRLADELPRATFVAIAGVGHAAHTERPDLVTRAIAGWLRATG